jgi:hypothetical protein
MNKLRLISSHLKVISSLSPWLAHTSGLLNVRVLSLFIAQSPADRFAAIRDVFEQVEDVLLAVDP